MAQMSSTLVLAVVQADDAARFLSALAQAGCGATALAARGGFLRQHAVAVLAHVQHEQIPSVVSAAQATCSRRTVYVTPVAEADLGYLQEPIEVEVGGAVIFGLAVTSSRQLASQLAGASRQAAAVDRSAAAPVAPTMTKEMPPMDTTPTTLLIAVVPDRAASRVVAALSEQRFGATTIGSTGGFLRRGNTTILTGVAAEQAEHAVATIQAALHAEGESDSPTSGVAFALPVEWRLRL